MRLLFMVLLFAGCAAVAPVANTPPLTSTDEVAEVYQITKENMIKALKEAFEMGFYRGWKAAKEEGGHGI